MWHKSRIKKNYLQIGSRETIMKEIKITKLNKLNKDERGNTFDFSIRETDNFILCTRKKSSISGNTYHEGKSSKTNPKIFILISGSIDFSFRHIDSPKPQTVVIDYPSIIEVKPKITHSIKALTDIIMLECNSIADIQNDRYSLNVFTN
jgi:hypothetical protein